MPEYDPPLPYKDGGMYIILSTIGRATQWHWGLFICVSHPWGQVYHATNRNDYWEFEEKMTDGIAGSRTIYAAIEVATLLEEDTISAVHNALKNVPVQRDGQFVQKWGEHFTCRVWIKDALDTLGSKGLMSFSSVEDLEQEAISIGVKANTTGCRQFRHSRHT